MPTCKKHPEETYPRRCKRCAVEYVVMASRRLKERAVEYKGGKCSVCGYNRCIAALDFHHVDPTTKSFQISSGTRAWPRVQEELDKCILVCSNCHKEIEHNGPVV